jgi:hypothetical protein
MRQAMLKILTVILFGSVTLPGCVDQPSRETDDKGKILQLEYKWLDAEFSADTIFLSSILDSTFICITESGVLTKQKILSKMNANKTYRLKNEIVIDSVRLENVITNLYGNTAVVTFIDHTYAKKKGTLLESTMQFYDVWIKRDNRWKAVSSQAHY